jgi:hypothetical protein
MEAITLDPDSLFAGYLAPQAPPEPALRPGGRDVIDALRYE